MDTNLKDRLIQERFPTIMVPRYEDLMPVSPASDPPPDSPRRTLHRYLAALRSLPAVPLVRRQGSALWGGYRGG